MKSNDKKALVPSVQEQIGAAVGMDFEQASGVSIDTEVNLYDKATPAAIIVGSVEQGATAYLPHGWGWAIHRVAWVESK